MSANPKSWPVDYAAYLAFETTAHERHELVDGEIVAMAGASPRHNILVERVHLALLPRGCQLLGASQRLVVETRDRSIVGYYPDLTVVCEPLSKTHPADPRAIVNPTYLVEVTSRSTERRDRGVKLEDYRAIGTLEGYLVVSHLRRELEYWYRDARAEWQRTVVAAGSSLEVFRVAVDDLYHDPLPPDVD